MSIINAIKYIYKHIKADRSKRRKKYCARVKKELKKRGLTEKELEKEIAPGLVKLPGLIWHPKIITSSKTRTHLELLKKAYYCKGEE